MKLWYNLYDFILELAHAEIVMNAKLLPEQILLRFIVTVLIVVFAWPVGALKVYAGSNRYRNAQYDDLSDAALITISIAGEIAWVGLLIWLAIQATG